MAIRGSEAKVNVAKKLAEAFGEDFIGEFDKKYYVWAKDGAERVQISIALTCPKNFVGVEGGNGETSNFPEPTAASSVEISDKERENIAAMMAALGL